MSRLIDAGLEQLTKMLLRMGELAYGAISLSLSGYIEGGEAYAQVKDLSDTLVLMVEDVEDVAFELIVRFQPVASDLRILKSYVKITYDFMRYGRYALDISEVQEKLGGLEGYEGWIKNSIKEMGKKVTTMVRISIDSLKSHDAELARTLSDVEKDVDDLYSKYIDDVVKNLPTMDRRVISSALVAKYLERIADHAAYVGESVIYIAKGEKVTLR